MPKQKIGVILYAIMILIPVFLLLAGINGSINVPWFPIENFEQLKGIMLAFLTIAVPFIGALGLLKIVAKQKINKKIKLLILVILIPLFCWFGFLSLVLGGVMFYYINNGPQIG